MSSSHFSATDINPSSSVAAAAYNEESNSKRKQESSCSDLEQNKRTKLGIAHT